MNRKNFFDLLKNRMGVGELNYIQIAYWLAKEAHRLQRRDTGERYFEHCRQVALILVKEKGIFDYRVIVSALLHDVLEDSFVPPEVLLAIFGAEIYEWLQFLSKSVPVRDLVHGKISLRAKKSTDEYFAGIRNGPHPLRMVKLADRIHNFRSFGCWRRARKKKYVTETKKYLLPIALETDAGFAAEIRKFIHK